jgi:hypothetical protein
MGVGQYFNLDWVKLNKTKIIKDVNEFFRKLDWANVAPPLTTRTDRTNPHYNIISAICCISHLRLLKTFMIITFESSKFEQNQTNIMGNHPERENNNVIS